MQEYKLTKSHQMLLTYAKAESKRLQDLARAVVDRIVDTIAEELSIPVGLKIEITDDSIIVRDTPAPVAVDVPESELLEAARAQVKSGPRLQK